MERENSANATCCVIVRSKHLHKPRLTFRNGIKNGGFDERSVVVIEKRLVRNHHLSKQARSYNSSFIEIRFVGQFRPEEIVPLPVNIFFR